MLELKSVCKTFNAGTINEKKALQNLSLHLKPGDFVTVIGGNGTIPSQTTSGQKLSSLPTATHSGSYSFVGWYTAASGGTQITTAYTFSADTTVYAHWTYTGGGGSYYAPFQLLYRIVYFITFPVFL